MQCKAMNKKKHVELVFKKNLTSLFIGDIVLNINERSTINGNFP